MKGVEFPGDNVDHAAQLRDVMTDVRADRDEIKRLRRLLERARRFIGARAGEKPEPALDLLLAIERETSHVSAGEKP